MATMRQIEPNRRDAPGRLRALKSGLDAESQFVTGEDRSEFARLQQEYITRFQPMTPEERFQVDTLLRSEWALRRLFRAEAQLWEYYTLRADRSEGVPLGEALVAGSEAFHRLQRRITLSERSYKEAFSELARLQRARRPVATSANHLTPDDPTQTDQLSTEDPPKSGSFLHSSVESEAGDQTDYRTWSHLQPIRPIGRPRWFVCHRGSQQVHQRQTDPPPALEGKILSISFQIRSTPSGRNGMSLHDWRGKDASTRGRLPLPKSSPRKQHGRCVRLEGAARNYNAKERYET